MFNADSMKQIADEVNNNTYQSTLTQEEMESLIKKIITERAKQGKYQVIFTDTFLHYTPSDQQKIMKIRKKLIDLDFNVKIDGQSKSLEVKWN